MWFFGTRGCIYPLWRCPFYILQVQLLSTIITFTTFVSSKLSHCDWSFSSCIVLTFILIIYLGEVLLAFSFSHKYVLRKALVQLKNYVCWSAGWYCSQSSSKEQVITLLYPVCLITAFIESSRLCAVNCPHCMSQEAPPR